MSSYEQSITGPIPWVPEWELVDRGPNDVIDPALTGHPLYEGLDRLNWLWLNGNNCRLTQVVISPLTPNVVGGGWSHLDDLMYMAIAEAQVGEGHLIHSQVETCARFSHDSVAARYLSNLVAYALDKTRYDYVQPLPTVMSRLPTISSDRVLLVPLEKVANRSLADDVAGNGKGGWSDQGSNDLRHFPVRPPDDQAQEILQVYGDAALGAIRLLNVPFRIAQTPTGQGQAVIVAADYPGVPSEVKAIPVARKVSRLLFLHTTMFNGTGHYVIHYADGSTAEVPVAANDWWVPTAGEELLLAWAKPQDYGPNVGVFLMPWSNPRPQVAVESVDLVSDSKGWVALLAVTGVLTGE